MAYNLLIEKNILLN